MMIKYNKTPVLTQGFDDEALLEGSEVTLYQKYVAQNASAYENKELAETMTDVLSYTVRSFESHEENRCEEAMAWAVTYLEPLTVDGEFNLTKGHFHLDKNYPEYYVCVSGEGRLIKWDGEEDVVIDTMTRGSVHWIDGRYAHRVCNVGKVPLNYLCIYNLKASHDYETIEKTGFPVRIYDDNGNVVFKTTLK